jgi:hypothetical protein
MKISDLRKELDKIEEENGDIEVLVFDAESDDLHSNPVVRVENCANIFSEGCWRTYYLVIGPEVEELTIEQIRKRLNR